MPKSPNAQAMPKKMPKSKRKKKKKKKPVPIHKPKPLPIEKKEKEILDTLEQHQVVIVHGNTGCGKSTQIPQMLLRRGYDKMSGGKKGIIACTQPRRIAASSLATRVAAELGCELGDEVGYQVRFVNCQSENTKILFLTDGCLVRSRDLSRFSVIMVDEVHERSIDTDLLLGMVKKELQTRRDLRVILSSATVDTDELSRYFYGRSPIIRIDGTLYNVEMEYIATHKEAYLVEVYNRIKEIVRISDEGDILVFLPGKNQIERVGELLSREDSLHLFVVPAHAELSSHQLRWIHKRAPPGIRKVVLSTNICETSLTIEGIVYVIDTGYVRIIEYKGKTGVNHLKQVRCSHAEADQRKGRAGRTQDGHCYRLYTEKIFEEEMPDIREPEITRLDLSSMVLQLKNMGYDDVMTFDFLEQPNMENIKAAHDHLHRLGALNDRCRLTSKGLLMAKFPLEPKLSAAVVKSSEMNCAEAVLEICAMMSAITGANINKLSPLVRTQHLGHSDPNFLTFAAVNNSFGEIFALRDILVEYMTYSDEELFGIQELWCNELELNYDKMWEAELIYYDLEKTFLREGLRFRSLRNKTAITECFLAGAFFELAETVDGESCRLMRDDREIKIQRCLLKPIEGRDRVIGMDLTKTPNNPVLLTCLTRIPDSVDITAYRNRFGVCCKHYTWPSGENDSISQRPRRTTARRTRPFHKPNSY